MDALRLHRLWLTLGWLWVGGVVYLSLTPKPPMPELGLFSWDKFNHFLAYAWLMAWFAQLHHRYRPRMIYALCFIAMGIGLEGIQGLGRARLFQYTDMLANALGVLFAYVLTLGSLGLVLQRLEGLVINNRR